MFTQSKNLLRSLVLYVLFMLLLLLFSNPVWGKEPSSVRTFTEGPIAELSVYDMETFSGIDKNLIPPISIRMTDGTELSGNINDILDQLEQTYGYAISPSQINMDIDEDGILQYAHQSQENPWPVGSYVVYFIFDGVRIPFTLTVKPHPIKSVFVEDMTFNEDFLSTRSFWDSDGEHSFAVYDTFPRILTITMQDGKVFSGDFGQVRNDLDEYIGSEYGIQHLEYRLYDDQSPDSLWPVGDYQAMFRVGPERCNYNVRIEPGIIQSLVVEDVYLTEDQSEWFDYWDEARQHVVIQPRFNFEPYIRVSMKDGSIYEGSMWSVWSQIESETGNNVSCRVDHDYPDTDSLPLGEFSGMAYFGRYVKPYKITVAPSIIRSIQAENQSFTEDNRGLIAGYRDSQTGEWVDINGYYLNPTVTVTLNNDREYKGDLQTVSTLIYQDTGVRINDNLDILRKDTQDWILGDYELSFAIGSQKVLGKFHIRPRLIQSAVAQDIYLSENDMVKYDSVSLLVTLTDGRIISGSFKEVVEKLMDLGVQVFAWAKQWPETQWGIGEHNVGLAFGNAFGDKLAHFSVIVLPDGVVVPNQNSILAMTDSEDENVRIRINADEKNEEPTEDEKKQIAEAVGQNTDFEVVSSFDIKVYAVEYDTQGNEIGREAVTQLKTAVTLTFITPNAEGKKYQLVRVHINAKEEVEVTLLPTTDNGDGTVSVESDRFSMYYLVETEENPYKPGDINGDGKVNIFDVIRLLKKVTGEDVETFANTDVNNDRRVNIFDVIRLLKYVTGEQVEVH